MNIPRAVTTLLRRPVALVVLAVAAAYAINFFYAVWLVSVAVERSIQLGSLAALVLMAPVTLLAFPLGWLSDLIGRRAVLLGAIVCNIVVAASPVLSEHMSAGWLLVALFLTGVSNAAWSAVGVANAIDSVNNYNLTSAHRRIVGLGFGIDGGKLAGAGLLIWLEAGDVLLVRIFTMGLLLLMLFGAAAKIATRTMPVLASAAPRRQYVWLLMFAFAGVLAIQELSGTQQAGMVAIAGMISGYGTATSNFAWVLGALLGNGLLLLKAPITIRYISISFLVYAAGFALLAASDTWAVVGIFLNGVGAALLWQTIRATVIRDFPAQYRGRFSGTLTAVENAAMAIDVALILNVGTFGGYGLAFLGATALTLVAITPITIILRQLPSRTS